MSHAPALRRILGGVHGFPLRRCVAQSTGAPVARLQTGARRWLSGGAQPLPPLTQRAWWIWQRRVLRVVRVTFLTGGIFAAGFSYGQIQVLEDVEGFTEETIRGVLRSLRTAKFLSLHDTVDMGEKARSWSVPAFYFAPGEKQGGFSVVRAAKDDAVWRSMAAVQRVFRRVKRTALRMSEEAAVSGAGKDDVQIHRLNMKNLHKPWRLIVTDNEVPNAFVVGLLPNTVFVTRGLFDHFARNDAELALVLSHELSHYLLKHTSQRDVAELFIKGGMMVLISLLDPTGGLGEWALELLLPTVGRLISAYISRDCESEADALGLEIVARAGYDPRDAVGMFKNMAALRDEMPDASIPDIFATHPLDETRLENAYALMPSAVQAYEDARRESARVERKRGFLGFFAS